MGEGALLVALAAALVIAFAGSGATPSTNGTPAASVAPDKPRKPRHCPAALRAVEHYSARVAYWQERLGVPKNVSHPGSRCPQYHAKVLRKKAAALRKRFNRWFLYHYAWSEWLPDKWARIGACETGYGRRPGSWSWDSGTYVSAFGIYRAGYTQYAHEIGQLGWDETKRILLRYPTPREQYNVALRIYYHYGFSGWGCRGA